MADQLITIADAEQAVIDELTPTYVIGTKVPDPLPPLFLRVVAVGGVPANMVTDNLSVVLEAFALKESDARTALADAVARLELAARKGRVGNETCTSLTVFSLPQNYPLPSVPSHTRYIVTIAPALRRRVTTL